MKDYRFIFQPYKGVNTRHQCPHCQSKKSWVLYIDKETGEELPPKFGKCEKLNSCGVHISPYKDENFLNEATHQEVKYNSIQAAKSTENTKSIHWEIVQKTLNPKFWSNNNFIKYLCDIFGNDKAKDLILKYFIGTTKQGETIFYYVNAKGSVKQGQIVHYNTNGHRNKEKPQSSVPSRLKLKGEYKQCFFGEHLLKQPNIKNIAFVESPKTAIIASGYNIQNIDVWLSYTSLTGLSTSKLFQVVEYLRGKNIFLFPDYHFQARMIAGLIPMRKEAGKMSLTGEEVQGYESQKDKLLNLTKNTCKVTIIDSPKGITDESGQDLADILTQEKPPELIHPPEDGNPKKIMVSCRSCKQEIEKEFLKAGLCLNCLFENFVLSSTTKEEKPLLKIIQDKHPLFNNLVESLGLEIGEAQLIPVEEELSKVITKERFFEKSKLSNVNFKDVEKFFRKMYNYPISENCLKQWLDVFCKNHNFSYIYKKGVFELCPF